MPDCTGREPGWKPALGTNLLKAVYKQGLSLCMLLPFCLGYKYVPYMLASLSFAISMENPVRKPVMLSPVETVTDACALPQNKQV